jgi:hypothetical protein
MKNIIVNSIGNSLGKKSLNISHNCNESSLFELNHSLVKQGYKGLTNYGPFNLKNILKNNLLEDDGIEDLHFY